MFATLTRLLVLSHSFLLAFLLLPPDSLARPGDPFTPPPSEAASPRPTAPSERAFSHSQSLPDSASSSWVSAVQENLANSEYFISSSLSPSSDSLYQAPNRAQNFRTHFSPSGFSVTPRTLSPGEAPPWSWGLSLTSIRRDAALISPAPASLHVSENRIEYRRDALTEWYINSPAGLEQGFTIHSPPLADLPSASPSPLLLQLNITGSLRAELNPADNSINFLDVLGARPIRFAKLLAFDSSHAPLPASFQLCSNPDGSQLLSILISDSAASYPITIDPVATSPAWTTESNQPGAEFGSSVAPAGDVNNDGFSDVIIGAKHFDNGQADEGRAFLYLGSASGLSLSPAWTAESNQPDAVFGWSVATAGDVNNDGFSDILVGSPRFENGHSDEGFAFLYLGSASGPSLSPDWSAEPDRTLCNFGDVVASAGDVNNDGFSDILVGAQFYDNGQTNEGAAFLYLGSAAGPASIPAWTIESDQAAARLGASLATAGDVNGDNFSDVIIGAPFFDNGTTNEGIVYVFHGSPAGLPLIPAWFYESGQASAHLGLSVAPAGDINGDGFSDVLLAAPDFDASAAVFSSGRVSIALGSATGLAAAPIHLTSFNNGELFGLSVSTAGDVNADGYSDFLVSAPLHVTAGTTLGEAYLYLGGPSVPTTPAWTSVFPNQANALTGGCVSTAGDVNGDGFSDFLVASPWYDNGQTTEGRVDLYLGAPSYPSTSPSWTGLNSQSSANFGHSASSAGDVNGDGYSDIIIGARFWDNGHADEGRAFLYHGSSSGPSASADWTAESDQASAFFGHSVASAGDVNADGFDDVLIAAPGYDHPSADFGRAFLYFGSAAGLGASGTPANADWAHGDPTGSPNSFFGQSVASAGDVNNDGFADILIGAHFQSIGQSTEGAAFLYLGSPAGPSLAPDWTGQSNQTIAHFGLAVSSAGDVNADGYSDILIGAPDFDSPLLDDGRVYLFLGSSSGPSAAPHWTFSYGQSDAFTGYSVAAAGDLNADGFADIIIGAPGVANGGPNAGRVIAFYGNASGTFGVSSTIIGSQANARLGHSVASAGDFDADGFADVIVGAPQFDTPAVNAGQVGLLRGAPNTVFFVPGSVNGDQSAAEFGFAVAPAGDVNGDGFSDFLVTEPFRDGVNADEGRVLLYYGFPGGARTTLPRQQWTDATTPIARLGLSNSASQFRIRAIMLTFFGRTRISMQHEVKPLGVLFDGTGLGEGSFSDTGNDGIVNFNRLVTGLAQGTRYHWRIRPRFDTAKVPFQKYGPWITMPFAGYNQSMLRTSGPAPIPCPADIAPAPLGDDLVNIDDLTTIILNWNSSDPIADVTHDGSVDIDDLTAVILAWGACP